MLGVYCTTVQGRSCLAFVLARLNKNKNTATHTQIEEKATGHMPGVGSEKRGGIGVAVRVYITYTPCARVRDGIYTSQKDRYGAYGAQTYDTRT